METRDEALALPGLLLKEDLESISRIERLNWMCSKIVTTTYRVVEYEGK